MLILKEVVMRRCYKSLALIFLLVAALSFSGCGNIRLKTFKDPDETGADIKENEDSDTDSEDINTLAEKNDSDETGSDNGAQDDKPTPTAIQPLNNIELLIYTVNSNSELDPVTALVPADTKITPQLIVETVVDSMADRSLVIGIESVTTKDDAVIISFFKDQPPLTNVGAGLEIAILDALAQSITENLDEFNKIIYRVEGGPYASGHIELGLDEVYFED